MKNAKKLKLIELFHRKAMKGSDKKAFDQMKDEDIYFQQEINDFEPIIKGFESLHLEQFQNNLSQFESKYKENIVAINTTTVRPLRKVYFAAAAIALLICAIIGYNVMMPSDFDQHFYASKSIAVHMESTRNGDNILSTPEQIKKSAFSAYQQKKYEKSINLIKDYLNTYPKIASKDYQSILVLGVAQLASGQAKKAAKNLEVVINSNDSSYRQEAEWMWVMTQYKLETPTAAKNILNKIANKKGHIHKKAAIELLNGL